MKVIYCSYLFLQSPWFHSIFSFHGLSITLLLLFIFTWLLFCHPALVIENSKLTLSCHQNSLFSIFVPLQLNNWVKFFQVGIWVVEFFLWYFESYIFSRLSEFWSPLYFLFRFQWVSHFVNFCCWLVISFIYSNFRLIIQWSMMFIHHLSYLL